MTVLGKTRSKSRMRERMDEVKDMDKRAIKDFLRKRNTIWTMGLCMTGVIVLGGLAAVDSSRRNSEVQIESGQQDMQEKTTGTAADDYDDASEAGYEASAGQVTTGEDSGEAADVEYAASAGQVTAGEDSGEAADVEYEASAGQVTAEDSSGEAADMEYETSAGRVTAEDSSGETPDVEYEASAGRVTAEDSSGETADMEYEATAGQAQAEDGTGESAWEEDAEANDIEAASGTVISEQALLDAGIAFDAEDSLTWPTAGTILLDYSMDGSIYFPTLNQYKYNPALIIGSETGNQVLASARGMVESVGIDEETGSTVVLNIGNGYRLTYGQLKELAVAEGDVVEEGELIGYISEPTKYYSEEGSSLYFKMTQDEETVDPVLYLEG